MATYSRLKHDSPIDGKFNQHLLRILSFLWDRFRGKYLK
ncbi:hypothetical protein O53_4647 [Microcystis aeruginosa TAIHU98]|uniref:Uncharacterized protein n=1 Tax=Microcystis aeruginosa TAIHU98 TaxID=1134457 RepID=L7E2M7_MICAE|nr:hypothetical protein O53_4647 [Microcystis aeruginosa TAIHU98]